MANDYFRFKDFIIYQDRSALKVNTDSCTFGAVASHPHPERILDIGSGTGLLALMMAQRYPASRVDAIEIDPDSAGQAADNFRQSPWAGRIQMHNLGLIEFAETVTDPYDLVLANPPWYINHQKSSDWKKNLARHDNQMLYAALPSCAGKLTARKGVFYTILPFGTAPAFIRNMEMTGLTCFHQVLIRSRKIERCLKIIMGFAGHGQEPINSEIIITCENGEFTPQYRDLLKDFYLAF